MIQLETTFVSGAGGFSANPLTYTQLKRNEKFAVYERSRNGKVCDYETFHIKVEPKGKKYTFPNGKTKVLEDDAEKYPTCSQFGRIAWSYSNVGMAMYRFHELTHGKVEVDNETPDEPETPECSVDVGSAPVKEVKEKKPVTVKDLAVTVEEFSKQELADLNGVQYVYAHNFVADGLAKGTVELVRKERRNVKGKPTSIFRMKKTA